ncbi:hypothetical protein DFQ27_004804 [Actinomortierella ambigua]|uniref:Uncharacterized protein n=1 Tax=Actinomortierella ambigua TaxID=1343610 RepID=A0A9P6Q448_9FUNG|nr:hypothetical protein DFQ27_004804 [Actinomortierella ambigua]
MSSTMRNQLLPDEVMWIIVEQVDDRRTLHALLTTSKLVFHAAVKRLWADPFRFLLFDREGFLCLLKYVLAISPCTRPDVVARRRAFSVSRLRSLRGRKHAGPYVNYLALIRHIEFDYDDLSDFFCDEVLMDIQVALPWAICDGHFGQLVTLTLLPCHVGEYLKTIPTMTRLTKIFWTRLEESDDSLEEIYRFVQAFVAEHGERGRQIDMAFEVDEFLDRDFYNSDDLIRIYRLLDPCPTSKQVIDNAADWARCLAHLEDMDFGHIRSISLTQSHQNLETVLPRCTRVETLSLRMVHRPLTLFGQALQDSQPCLQQSLEIQPPKGAPVFFPPPLKSISFSMPMGQFPSTMETLASSLGSTLEEIRLNLDCITSFDENPLATIVEDGVEAYHLQTVRWDFPQLRHLIVRNFTCEALTFDQGDMSGTPRLEHLEILTPFLGSFVSAHVPGWPESPRKCVQWRLPQLCKLMLDGPLAAQFNPISLAHSPLLQELSFNTAFPLTWTCKEGAEAPRVQCSTVPLPALTYLTLCGQSLLNLDIVTRAGPVDTPANGLAHGGGSGKTKSLSRPLSPPPLLTRLEKRRRRDQCRDPIYRGLLQADRFPRLQMLNIGSLPYTLLSWLVQAACQLPQLRHVNVASMEDTVPAEFELSCLGLAQSSSISKTDRLQCIYFSFPVVQGYKKRCLDAA